jgi:hypothetical protein
LRIGISAAAFAVVEIVAIAAVGCASLPRPAVSSRSCAGGPSAIVVRTVDRQGAVVPDVRVGAVKTNRSMGTRASTSALGTARLALPPGSYSVSVGGWENPNRQGAHTFIKLPPGCTLTLEATLIVQEIRPWDES